MKYQSNETFSMTILKHFDKSWKRSVNQLMTLGLVGLFLWQSLTSIEKWLAGNTSYHTNWKVNKIENKLTLMQL